MKIEKLLFSIFMLHVELIKQIHYLIVITKLQNSGLQPIVRQ